MKEQSKEADEALLKYRLTTGRIYRETLVNIKKSPGVPQEIKEYIERVLKNPMGEL